MSQGPRRTQALRAPGEGVYTPPQSVAASNPCLNCGTNVQLEYCPECGQRATDTDPTLREFLRELAADFLRWDGKLIKTFRMLVMEPGKLTLEYLEGRRVRYISPIRTFLTCSFIFLFLKVVLPPSASFDQHGIPGAAFILVPVFAALVGVVYRRRRKRYPQHLAFALHVQAALFLTFSLMLAGGLISTGVARWAYLIIIALGFAVYLVRATRAVYG